MAYLMTPIMSMTPSDLEGHDSYLKPFSTPHLAKYSMN